MCVDNNWDTWSCIIFVDILCTIDVHYFLLYLSSKKSVRWLAVLGKFVSTGHRCPFSVLWFRPETECDVSHASCTLWRYGSETNWTMKILFLSHLPLKCETGVVPIVLTSIVPVVTFIDVNSFKAPFGAKSVTTCTDSCVTMSITTMKSSDTDDVRCIQRVCITCTAYIVLMMGMSHIEMALTLLRQNFLTLVIVLSNFHRKTDCVLDRSNISRPKRQDRGICTGGFIGDTISSTFSTVGCLNPAQFITVLF